MKKKISTRGKKTVVESDEALLGDIRLLIEETRAKVAQTVNTALVLMNWHIGRRINDEILKNKRAEYGAEILLTLSAKLTEEYGKGFTRTNLIRMRQFADLFQDVKIVATLSHQLSWSHF